MKAPAFIGACMLSACSSVPPVDLYAPVLPDSYVNQPPDANRAAARSGVPDEDVARFWRDFHDPQLNALVEQALRTNADVRIAVANLREARAVGRFTDAQLWPTVDVVASAARVRAPFNNGPVDTKSVFSAGLDMSWEVDLFGRLSNERVAARAQALASEAGLQGTQLSVSAEVARNYFDMRGLQERLRVAHASLQTQQAILDLVDARQQAGRGTAFDTERTKALLGSTAATVPALEASVLRTRYRLSTLCGLTPASLDAELSEPKPLPGLRSVQLGAIDSPESLLRRRPDVRAAEQQAYAAAARVGVARSALFPRVTLGGTLGQNAFSVGDLGKGSSYVYNLGAQLVWNLIDFGRVRALIEAADAHNEAVLADYERAVLNALEETEGALASYTRSQQQADHLYDAARAAEAAAVIARERFRVGTTDFLSVLDAERELLLARDNLAQAQTAAATSLVVVYKALAGGWGPPGP
jgi:multidrug efflux system outer membrane protein